MAVVGIVVVAVVVGGIGYYAGTGMVGTTISTTFQTVSTAPTVTATQTTTTTTVQAATTTVVQTVSGGGGTTTKTLTIASPICSPPVPDCVVDADGDGV